MHLALTRSVALRCSAESPDELLGFKALAWHEARSRPLSLGCHGRRVPRNRIVNSAESVGLDQLLTSARDAAPGDRIELRDPIAAYGESAIDAMADWVSDPRLAGFAIRVLERIGSDESHRLAVLS